MTFFCPLVSEVDEEGEGDVQHGAGHQTHYSAHRRR